MLLVQSASAGCLGATPRVGCLLEGRLVALPDSLQVTRNAWDRQADESPLQFEAFAAFRDMGPTRTCAQVARQLTKSPQLISRWALKNRWIQRAEAYEDFIDQNIQRKNIGLRRQHAQRVLKTAQTIGEKVMEGLMALEMVTTDGAGKKKLAVTPAELVRMFQIANQEERQILGRADENTITQIVVNVENADRLEREAIAAGLEVCGHCGATKEPGTLCPRCQR